MPERIPIDDTGDSAPTPYPGGQQAFCGDWTNWMVGLEGGWMSGKSWCGAHKLLTLHQINAFDVHDDPTGVKGAAVAPTVENAREFVIPALEEAAKDFGMSYEIRSMHRLYGMSMIFTGAARCFGPIIIKSADKAERITGWQVGHAWGDEPARWPEDYQDPKRDAFIQLLGRVRDPKALLVQLLFTYTNEGDETRIFDEFHSGKPGRALYRAATDENPLAHDFFERQRENLTPELEKQYLQGKAINLSGGKVYSDFDEALHVDDTIELDDSFPLQMMIDFNIDPGMHILLGQYDELKDQLTVVHEIYGPRMNIKQSILEFDRLLSDMGGFTFPELQIFGDATGTNEWVGTSDSCYDILFQSLDNLENGVGQYRTRVPAQNPPVLDRENAFNVALRDIPGNVHWHCNPRCRELINDLRKMKRSKRKTDKKLSHSSDAEGYRISFIRPVRVDREETGGRIGV